MIVANVGSTPHSVSDLLCQIADALVRWEIEIRAHARAAADELTARVAKARPLAGGTAHHRRRGLLGDWLFARNMRRHFDQVDEAILADREGFADPVWTLDVAGLLARPEFDGLRWPPSVPRTTADAATLVRAAMLADLWHAPLEAALAESPFEETEAHADARVRLDTDSRYNDVTVPGMLIPAHATPPIHAANAPVSFEIGALRRYLTYTTFLPTKLMAADVDGRACFRGIDAVYRAPRSRASADGRTAPAEWKVAIAPLAEAAHDVNLVPRNARSAYALAVDYPAARIDAAVASATERGAHLLFIPEMALPEAHLARLSDAVFDARRQRFAATGELPELRYVAAGVLGDAPNGGEHENYVVLLDAEGREVARQLKLSHWDLSRDQQDRFGVTFHHAPAGPLADPLCENSRIAPQIEIVDLPALGRLMTLICADVNQNDPGDWIMANLGLDWLHFPIMDKSVCWARAASFGYGPPWIVSRAYRASRASRARVIVTNSMSLTLWVNAENARTHSPFGQFDTCGIALMLDAADGPTRQDHVSAGVTERDVTRIVDWAPARWPVFPVPAY